VETLWAKPADIDLVQPASPIHFVEWLPLAAMTALALWFGLNASFTMKLANLAATALAGSDITGGLQ
jgi:hypothetical protein